MYCAIAEAICPKKYKAAITNTHLIYLSIFSCFSNKFFIQLHSVLPWLQLHVIIIIPHVFVSPLAECHAVLFVLRITWIP